MSIQRTSAQLRATLSTTLLQRARCFVHKVARDRCRLDNEGAAPTHVQRADELLTPFKPGRVSC
jgi:hypothetical protein